MKKTHSHNLGTGREWEKKHSQNSGTGREWKNPFPSFGQGNQRLSFLGMGGNGNSRSPLCQTTSLQINEYDKKNNQQTTDRQEIFRKTNNLNMITRWPTAATKITDAQPKSTELTRNYYDQPHFKQTTNQQEIDVTYPAICALPYLFVTRTVNSPKSSGYTWRDKHHHCTWDQSTVNPGDKNNIFPSFWASGTLLTARPTKPKS